MDNGLERQCVDFTHCEITLQLRIIYVVLMLCYVCIVVAYGCATVAHIRYNHWNTDSAKPARDVVTLTGYTCTVCP